MKLVLQPLRLMLSGHWNEFRTNSTIIWSYCSISTISLSLSISIINITSMVVLTTERERQRDYVLRPSQAHVSTQNCSASECIRVHPHSLPFFRLLGPATCGSTVISMWSAGRQESPNCARPLASFTPNMFCSPGSQLVMQTIWSDHPRGWDPAWSSPRKSHRAGSTQDMLLWEWSNQSAAKWEKWNETDTCRYNAGAAIYQLGSIGTGRYWG